jgi:hypothetical protein
MVGFVDLQCAFDTLHKAKQYRQAQYKSSDPKRVPLDTLSAIVPPLIDSARFLLIKGLLQNDQTIMPKMELVYLAVFGAEMSALSGLAIEVVLGFLHLEPLPTFWIMLWKEES